MGTGARGEVVFVCEDDLWAVAVGFWAGESQGGAPPLPRRLTALPPFGAAARPVASGGEVAFAVAEEGYEEVHVIDGRGGRSRRLTRLGAASCAPVAWDPRAGGIVVASDARSAGTGTELFVVSRAGAGARPRDGGVTPLPLGPADAAAFEPGGGPGRLVARGVGEPGGAEWKGYRGGRAGDVFVDADGDGRFERLPIDEKHGIGKCAAPQWAAGGRLLMAVDGEGHLAGAIVSVDARTGGDLVVHASPGEWSGGFWCRMVSIDAEHADGCARRGETSVRAVFCAGGRIFVLEARLDRSDGWTNDVREVRMDWRGTRSQAEPRELSAYEELDAVAMHPEGLKLLAIARGQAFAFGLWEGPVLSFPAAKGCAASPRDRTPVAALAQGLGGDGEGGSHDARLVASTRVRLAAWLFDARRLVLVSDAGGEEGLEVHWEHRPSGSGARVGGEPKRLRLDSRTLGRVEEMSASPQAPLLALVNHKHELLVVDVDSERHSVADRSPSAGGIEGLAWSPCGNWLAYSRCEEAAHMATIRILDVRSGEARTVTNPLLEDTSPSWDPAGDFLYFLASREAEPVYDELKPMDVSFPRVQKPFVLPLKRDTPNPLLPMLRTVYDDDDSGADDGDEGSEYGDDDEGANGSEFEEVPPDPIEIDFEGILDRAVALPLESGRYGQVAGIDKQCLVYTVFPVVSAPVGIDVDEDEADGEGDASSGSLVKFSLRHMRESTLIERGVVSFSVSMDGRTTLVEGIDEDGNDEVRVFSTGAKPPTEDSDDEEVDPAAFTPQSGLIDLDRVRLLVEPEREWAQMLVEAWRLFRDEAALDPDHAAGIDWTGCLRRHAALLARVACRSELEDLMQEMVGELRSSHAWVGVADSGRDSPRSHRPGYLGADFAWDDAMQGYRVLRVLQGDTWDERRGGPLAKPGVNVGVGDAILSIDRVRLTPELSPADLLLNAGGREVLLEILSAGSASIATQLAGLRVDAGKAGGKRNGKDKGKSKASASTEEAAKKKRSKGQLREKRERGAGGEGSSAKNAGSHLSRLVRVRCLSSEVDARYRDLIGARRARVHARTSGRVGYLHMPDTERLGLSGT